MRFYILSDLHLSSGVGDAKAADRIKKLCAEIRKTTEITETVLFIILGDIIDRGAELSFQTAQDSLTLILDELKEHSVKFEFVPGNHDIEKTEKTLNLFDQLIAKYGSTHAFENASTYSCIYDGVNFIFSDSNLSRNHAAPGQLDIQAIRAKINPGLSNVLICHHALSHGHGDPHDTIENSATVFAQLNELGISFLFHGHVHRSDITIPDKGLIEIGFGTLLGDVSWMNSVFHQFSVGYIQNGRIVLVQRWLDTSDGYNHFAVDELYPKPKSFADPNSIGKLAYAAADNYIPRTVSSYEFANSSSFARLFGSSKSMSLKDAVLKHKKILMLCDAGMGKSIELKNLAHEFSEMYHTCFFSLSDYTGQDIFDILPSEYKLLPSNRMMLLFDGFDELDNTTQDVFKKKLRVFSQDFSAASIVISSRSNFCGNEDSNESKTFMGFYVFILEKLSVENVKTYLYKCGIDVDQFWINACTKRVSDLVYNPFYLVRLAAIYTQEQNLPVKNALMDKLISDTFDLDELKFSGNLGDHYIELFSVLEHLAFAMQLMKQQKFDDRKEYQNLFSFEERELVKKSGLLKRDGASWSFLHNNFREYLTARYLSKLPSDIVVPIFSDGSNVKPSWVNTLGYLTGFELEWSLFDWLVDNSPSALVKFEPDRLSSDIRVNVFKRIFGKFEELHLHFNDDLCDESELAHFTNSSEILTMLIDRIETPKHFTSQYIATNILRQYPSLFGKESTVRECLINCCEKYPTTRKEICRLALLALCEHGLQTPETTKRLIAHLGNSEEDYIRLGLYEYLLESGEHNTHVKYFLDGIKFIEHRIHDNDDPRISNELFELIHGLKSMNTIDSVTHTFAWFANKKHLHFHNSKEVLESLTDAAVTLYRDDHSEIFDVVLSCYIESSKKWNGQVSQAAVRFFRDTGTLNVAATMAMEAFEAEPQHMSDLIGADMTVIEHLKTAYMDGSLKSHLAFQRIVIWFVRSECKYNEYATIIKEIDGVDLPEFKQSIDYEAKRNNATQEYFDALFDTTKRTNLFDELIKLIANPEITTHQLLDIDIDLDYDSALGRFRSAIYRYSRDIKVSEFFEKINLDNFVIWAASQVVLEKNSVFVTQSHRDKISAIIENMMETDTFENCVKYHSGSISVKPFIPELLSLILYLDYPLSEEMVLNLTELPTFVFDHDNDKAKYSFLTEKIPIRKLKARLIQNVSIGKVEDMVLRDHIEFFDSCKDPSLAERALKICKQEDNTYLRYAAWQYLYHALGTEYLCDEILPFANGDFLIEINGSCKDIQKMKLKEAMEREYKAAPSTQLQAHLITFGSKIAVEDYVSRVSTDKHPPEGKSISIDGPTEAISTLRDPSFLPLLEKLIVTVFDPEFNDCSWRTLRGALSKALVNCGVCAYDDTIDILNKHRPSAAENELNFRFCNYTMVEIEHARKIAFDAPKTFSETKKLLSDLKEYH